MGAGACLRPRRFGLPALLLVLLAGEGAGLGVAPEEGRSGPHQDRAVQQALQATTPGQHASTALAQADVATYGDPEHDDGDDKILPFDPYASPAMMVGAKLEMTRFLSMACMGTYVLLRVLAKSGQNLAIWQPWNSHRVWLEVMFYISLYNMFINLNAAMAEVAMSVQLIAFAILVSNVYDLFVKPVGGCGLDQPVSYWWMRIKCPTGNGEVKPEHALAYMDPVTPGMTDITFECEGREFSMGMKVDVETPEDADMPMGIEKFITFNIPPLVYSATSGGNKILFTGCDDFIGMGDSVLVAGKRIPSRQFNTAPHMADMAKPPPATTFKDKTLRDLMDARVGTKKEKRKALAQPELHKQCKTEFNGGQGPHTQWWSENKDKCKEVGVG